MIHLQLFFFFSSQQYVTYISVFLQHTYLQPLRVEKWRGCRYPIKRSMRKALKFISFEDLQCFKANLVLQRPKSSLQKANLILPLWWLKFFNGFHCSWNRDQSPLQSHSGVTGCHFITWLTLLSYLFSLPLTPTSFPPNRSQPKGISLWNKSPASKLNQSPVPSPSPLYHVSWVIKWCVYS